jgi:nitrous oxidase accessory protein NosD
VIFGNRLVGNTESGIFLAGSSNVISANDIADNKWGVFFTPQLAAPHENKFYHNNFVNNTNNIYISEDAGAQLWDGGYSSGGNYWSDYASVNPNAKTVGNSDTWDMPYVISANNADD